MSPTGTPPRLDLSAACACAQVVARSEPLNTAATYYQVWKDFATEMCKTDAELKADEDQKQARLDAQRLAQEKKQKEAEEVEKLVEEGRKKKESEKLKLQNLWKDTVRQTKFNEQRRKYRPTQAEVREDAQRQEDARWQKYHVAETERRLREKEKDERTRAEIIRLRRERLNPRQPEVPTETPAQREARLEQEAYAAAEAQKHAKAKARARKGTERATCVKQSGVGRATRIDRKKAWCAMRFILYGNYEVKYTGTGKYMKATERGVLMDGEPPQWQTVMCAAGGSVAGAFGKALGIGSTWKKCLTRAHCQNVLKMWKGLRPKVRKDSWGTEGGMVLDDNLYTYLKENMLVTPSLNDC